MKYATKIISKKLITSLFGFIWGFCLLFFFVVVVAVVGLFFSKLKTLFLLELESGGKNHTHTKKPNQAQLDFTYPPQK